MAFRLLLTVLFAVLVACQKMPSTDGTPPGSSGSATPPTATTGPTPPAPHAKPRCATQDCKTKQIIDDGCVDDPKAGRLCAACVNPCP